MSLGGLASSSHNPFPVEPTGFLIGSCFACILYGLHLSQLHHFFSTYSFSKLHFVVCWLAFLSTSQIVIILGSCSHYFVSGINDPVGVWGEFWWPLSIQDGLIPLVAFTAQLYFGLRAWILIGRKRWFGIGVIVLPTITLSMGIALAITARLWADDPFVTLSSFDQRTIGVPSQIVAITWMGLTAMTDGILTFSLVFSFLKAKRPLVTSSQRLGIITRLVALTLETVLLTHIVGATMCIIFLVSPAATRTCNDFFWVLLECISELYALSMLFTINSRTASLAVQETHGPRESSGGIDMDLRQSVLDRQVEGYQGAPLCQISQLTNMGLDSQSRSRGSERTEDSASHGAVMVTPDLMTPRTDSHVSYFNGAWAMMQDHSKEETTGEEEDDKMG